MPRTVEEVLRWAEHLSNRQGTYAMAMKRVVRYFLTKIEIYNASDAEKKMYESSLNVSSHRHLL